MPLSVINTLYDIKMFIKKKTQKRKIKSKSVTTFVFGILLGRYAAFEIVDSYRFWYTI